MSNFFIAVGIVFALLIAVILALLYALSNKSKNNNQQDKKETRRYIHDSIESIFRQQSQKLVDKYSNDLIMVEWIESQLDKEEVDLNTLAQNANRRTLAIAIKNTEDEVTFASNDLLKITTKLSQAEACLCGHISGSVSGLAERETNILNVLETQRDQAEKRLENARARLEKLTLLATQFSSVDSQNQI